MTPLAEQHCTSLHAGSPALDEDAAGELLAQIPGWSIAGGTIVRDFTFSDFFGTMAFVNALAWIAHREDHHPELVVGFDHCEVRYRTHSVGGLSVNDFICAAKIEALSA